MRGNVQALFGGEGLVFLGNQDPASYPTFFVKITPMGLLLHRSVLSCFPVALDSASVEGLRSVFLQDALTHSGPAEDVSGLWDRRANR